MARFARVVVPGIPHHITQRGNARQFILENDADRAVYLQLLGQYCRLHEVSLAGYCLMRILPKPITHSPLKAITILR